MSQKQPKPVLTGQRLKSRKRDEKKKFDPAAFRDELLRILGEADNSLDNFLNLVDSNADKIAFREYAEQMFDVLFAGGLLAPGGSIVEDGAELSPMYVFKEGNGAAEVDAFVDMLNRLIRRYKYLQKSYEANLRKFMLFVKGFDEAQRERLARALAGSFDVSLAQCSVLLSLRAEAVVKDGTAMDFCLRVIKLWVARADMKRVTAGMRNSEVTDRLLEFLPMTQRKMDVLERQLVDAGLQEMVAVVRTKALGHVKALLQQHIKECVSEERAPSEIAALINGTLEKENVTLPDGDVAVILWHGIMSGVEFNKKVELMADQALKHLKTYTKLIGAYTKSKPAEWKLITNIQDFCYDNMNFMKLFQKVCLLLYNNDVLSEETIMRWFKEPGGSQKGKSAFIKQMEKMVEWLQSAEEESSEEEED